PSLLDGLSSTTVDPRKTAVVSTLYTDSFIWGTAVLGYSVRQANVSSRLLLPYLEDRISSEALCIAEVVGWEPIAVPLISPPHNGKGIHHRFSDQYTKLNIWGLDKIGIERAVYLDSDTLVRRNINELFQLPFTFGAVPDVDGGFIVTFNAGVLALRPSSAVLDQMKSVLETAVYPLQQAEQSFLNLFFAANVVRLPYAYNANLGIKSESPALWESMKDEIRVVHYTGVKPFVREHSGNTAMPTEAEIDAILREAALRHDGFFAEEVGWWHHTYIDMLKELRPAIRACLQR
ncbi:glycosyltransferase family 8 protein, partial [Collybiopsis luxurians FD-317 M1]